VADGATHGHGGPGTDEQLIWAALVAVAGECLARAKRLRLALQPADVPTTHSCFCSP
jgi:hypothetical protein